ncbi:hypothetical protein H4R20_002110 [Coemansia guatemalensis]|uniref:Nuclear pore complex protein Nup160 n=1 Tax=Coemansia guatemalensis TaxID=2761395 RepID=A0A9W8HYB6_9FUNG|nr:hypothetical protein H4R20_002110 [Coemansia guatemalensis]
MSTVPAAATAAMEADAVDEGEGAATSLQLQLYQTVLQHPDNIFPYTRVLPVHNVPSPDDNTGTLTRKTQSAHGDQLAVHLDRSTKSSLYTLRSRPDTCIQWRLLADRQTLELRPVRWVSNPEAADEDPSLRASETEVSVTSTWRFESPLLENVVLYDEINAQGSASVSLTVCAQDGIVYRLSFASVWGISSDSVDVNACTSWYQVKWCGEAGRQPLLFDGLGKHAFVIGCEDSALVWLQWPQQTLEIGAYGSLQDAVTEKVTSSSGIIKSVKEFIPRILRRGGSTVTEDEDAQKRLISFAVTQVQDGSVQYAVTLSRDRRLRFWSSSSGSACQHEELLPQLDILGSPIPVDPHAQQQPLVDDSARNYVRIISHSMSVYSHDTEMEAKQDNIFGVLVFVPDEAVPYFTLLQVIIDTHGRIGGVQTIMYKVCKAANGASQLMAEDELVDFQLSYHEEVVTKLLESPGGQPVEEEVSSPYWTLWALWERAQETVLTYTYFSLRPSSPGDISGGFEFEGHSILGERWYTVLSTRQDMRPTNDGSYVKEIEARLTSAMTQSEKDGGASGAANGNGSDEPGIEEAEDERRPVQVADISNAFLDHLFHPFRFDRGVLEHALKLYEASARDRGFDFPTAPYTVVSSSPHLRQRVAAVVGSFVRVETSQSDGSMMVDEYHRALFTEWMRYSTLCSRIQRVANTPMSLSVCPSTHMVSIVCSNSVMTLQTAGEVEWMHAFLQRDAAAMALLAAPAHAVAEKYPGLAFDSARSEVTMILSAASYVTATIAEDRRLAFTEEIAREASGEMLVSHETRAAELFEKYAAGSVSQQHVRQAARMLGRCQTPGDTIRALLQMLVQSTDTAALLSPTDDAQSFKSSASMDALFAAGFTASASARFEIARDILLLLVCITYHSAEVGPMDVGDLPSLLAMGFGAFSLVAVTQWLVSQSISACGAESLADDAAAADGFLRKFSVLNINRRRDSAGSVASKPLAEPTGGSTGSAISSTFVYSLLHDMLCRHYALRFTGSSGVFADMVTEGVQQIYATLGFGSGRAEHLSQEPGMQSQTNLVLFAAKLEQSEPAELTEAFLRLLPKSTATSYLFGLVFLRMRDFANAVDSFSSASVAYAQADEGISDGVDLQHVLPDSVLEPGHPYAYFEHVAELFESAGYLAGASQFSHYALESLGEEPDLEGMNMSADALKERQQKLWFKVFHAELECKSYEEAYMAMMANPDQKLQLDCLRHLTGVLCEREGGVAILCRLGFPGLQEEIERNLLFKARHSDILALPNYYKILYSFHVYRGNYRNAASAMYQYAQRLSIVMRHSGDVAQLLVDQGQALLACINGLSIVDKQYAWVVVGRQQGATADSAEPGLPGLGDSSAKRKRRRIAIGRYDTSSNSQGQDIDIVELEDVRREYALCMARITLGTTFQELFSRNVLLEPEDAIALYVKLGMYDNALTFAKTFALKLDYIFTSLVQRCLELSAAKSTKAQQEQTPEAFWENQGVREAAGTPSERAWRLLQYYLDLEESSDGTSTLHHRLLVADTILKAEYDAALPPWLSSLLLRRCPQDLVRLCLRSGCVSEGGEFLLQHVNALCSRITAPDASIVRTTREFWLPYQLVDQTMGILDDAVVRFEEAVDKIKQARKDGGTDAEMARLKALLRGYRERLAGLQRLRDDLKSSIDRYMAFAARESRDINSNIPAESTAATNAASVVAAGSS